MPIKEECSKQLVISALKSTAMTSTTVYPGGIIDTADYDNGIYFALMVTAWTAGSTTMTIYEDSAVAMGTETIVTSLIFTAPTLSAATATTSIATPVAIPKLGVYGTKRYLRCKLTGVAATNLTAAAVAIANPEIAPTAQTI